MSRTPAGYLLTDAGRALHERGLAVERKGVDAERLGQAYERFLALNGQLKAVAARWQSADEDARFELLGELADLVGRVKPALRRTAEQLPRFEPYLPRLRKAMSRAEEGQFEYVVSPTVDSVHTVWMELHEDYLLTQGITREQEGSY